MFCPRCGQEQATQEMRFCSRCGFPLGLISEVLSHGGFLPQLADLYKDKTILTRRNGLIFSLFWFLTFVLILAPIAGILDIDPIAGMCAVIGVFGGLLISLASLFFLKNPDRAPAHLQNSYPAHLHGASTNRNALPNAAANPATDFVPPMREWQSPETADFAKPPSVTEDTTKLFNKNSDQ